MKKYKTAIILFAVFEIIAICLWLATGSLFYLLNFSYIGVCIGGGLALSKAGFLPCPDLEVTFDDAEVEGGIADE